MVMSVDSAICDKPKRRPGVFSTGFALFSMFFGAGNLIFPLLIGKTSGTETPAALVGLMISAVAFPLMGLIAMMLYQGNLHRFLERLGKGPSRCLMFVLLVTQGPLCMSRLFTLMYASIQPYLPLSLAMFSVLAGILVFFLTYRPQRIVSILGVILTPFLILSLAALVFSGMMNPPPIQQVFEGPSFHFLHGLKGGYMTMDLISALLFATMILPYLSQGLEHLSEEAAEKEVRRKMVGASLFAALLLMLAYLGLCSLSAHYSPVLGDGVAPQDLLRTIAVQILGPLGGAIAAIAVFLACFTTAIALAAVFADYLRKDLLKERISSEVSLGTTLVITAGLANLGFSGLLKLMGPLLETLYPSLIILCVLNIAYSLYRVKPLKVPVFLALALALAGLMKEVV